MACCGVFVRGQRLAARQQVLPTQQQGALRILRHRGRPPADLAPSGASAARSRASTLALAAKAPVGVRRLQRQCADAQINQQHRERRAARAVPYGFQHGSGEHGMALVRELIDDRSGRQPAGQSRRPPPIERSLGFPITESSARRPAALALATAASCTWSRPARALARMASTLVHFSTAS